MRRSSRSAILVALATVLSGCAANLGDDPIELYGQEAITRAGAAPVVSRTIYFPIEGGPYRISNGAHAGHENAWDVLGSAGTEIRAIADGIVTQVRLTGGQTCTSGASCSNQNANYVVVEHNFEGFIVRSQYLHLQNEPEGSPLRCLSPGVLVRQGQVIGHMGDTGYTDPAHTVHLHFQLQQVCASYWCTSVPYTSVNPAGFADVGHLSLGNFTGGAIAGALPASAACEDEPVPPSTPTPTPTPGGGAVCADGPTIAGIDVSRWQGRIDWDAIATSHTEFAFIRVSDGLGYPDGEYARNWSEARRVGIVRGTYQYFRASQDPIAQANLLLSAMGALSADDLPPVLDLETLDGQSAAVAYQRAVQWLDHVAAATGRTPIVYTGYYFFRDSLGNPDLGGYPLWIAQYGPTCPRIPDRWYRWDFHQTSDSGRVAGIPGNVDTNVFNGDLAALLAFAGGAAPPPRPTPPPSSTCPYGEGLYCGQASLGQEPGHLYRCTGGSYQLVEACPSGCTVAPPGQPDACSSAPAPLPPPPAGTCQYGDGLYCGSASLGQSTSTLYRCAAGTFTVVQACSNGCTVAPPGQADYCASAPPPPPPPPATCPYGDGLYCGSASLGQSTSTLYRCTAGSFSVVQACSNGCTVAPPGQADYCASAPTPPPATSCPYGNGLYCGSASLGQSTRNLYQCTNGSYSLVQACTNGCYVAPPGQADRCN